VEVLRRYSNAQDLVKRVQDVLRRIEESDQQDEPGVLSTGSGGGRVPVRRRLSEADLAQLAASRRAGTTLPELAERYGISLSGTWRWVSELLAEENRAEVRASDRYEDETGTGSP
jgi:hypothetical protein